MLTDKEIKKVIKSYKNELQNIKESIIYAYEIKNLNMQKHFIKRQKETESKILELQKKVKKKFAIEK